MRAVPRSRSLVLQTHGEARQSGHVPMAASGGGTSTIKKSISPLLSSASLRASSEKGCSCPYIRLHPIPTVSQVDEIELASSCACACLSVSVPLQTSLC